MSEYYVTFGQLYRSEPHPTLAEAHPDGWLTIVAADETAARTAANEHLGRAWAFIYGEDDPNRPPVYQQDGVSAYPLGELARFSARAVLA